MRVIPCLNRHGTCICKLNFIRLPKALILSTFKCMYPWHHQLDNAQRLNKCSWQYCVCSDHQTIIYVHLTLILKKNQQQPPYRCFHGGLSSAHGSIGVNSRLTLKSFPSLGYEVTGLNTNRGHRAGRLGTRRTTVKWVIKKNCVNNCWRKRLQEDNRGWCIASCSFMMVPY